MCIGSYSHVICGSNIPLVVGAWGSNIPLVVGAWGSNIPLVVVVCVMVCVCGGVQV